ncbi:MAG TPA: hypothetical protein VIG69_15100 [Candidatus Methylomirabilis sp.]
MADDVKDLHHMLTIWNASSNPLALSTMQVRNLAEYLANYLRSGDGERYLATLGYTRAPEARR